ncbi:MAG: hypothetical protein BGO26_10270 [Actinobacteria bacterium 69-20]|nr:hypothetical protein [Actinomycetota bacterium]OJV23282.1 MAG: hypothetical protein BGO26_10270 [Actinobacteria bacterium 69-20]
MTNLLTSAEVVAAVGLTTAISARDQTLIDQIAASIGPVIEGIIGPVQPRDETYTANGGVQAITLPHRPNAIASVTVNGTPSTQWYAVLDWGVVYCGSRLAPYPFPPGEVVIAYSVGYATVPANVVYAAMEQCRIWWQQGQQSLHVAYGYDEQPGTVPMGFAVSTRVRELLAPKPAPPGFA